MALLSSDINTSAAPLSGNYNPLSGVGISPAGLDTSNLAVSPTGQFGTQTGDVNGKPIYNTIATQDNPSTAFLSTPVVPQKITSNDLKQTQPVTVPQAPISTANNVLTATVNSAFVPPANTTVNDSGTATPIPPPAQPDNSNRTDILTRYDSLNSQLGTKTNTTNDLNTQFGVDQKQQSYIDAYNQYNQKKLSYQQDIEKLYNNPGLTREQATQQVGELQRVANADLANLAVITQAAQGNYQGALDIVKRKIDAQFEPIQAQIDNLGKYAQLNNEDLTDSEKVTLENKRFQMQNELDQLKTAKTSAHQFALQQGITDQSILTAIDNATTPTEAYAAIQGGYGQSGGNDQYSNINPQYQSYVSQLKDGTTYVNQDTLKNLTAFQQQEAARQYAQAGIKVLPADKSDKLDNINVTKDNLDQLQQLVNKKLGSGVGGRIVSGFQNKLSEMFQSDPEISAFNSYRDTAINTIQALAGGSGSGFRLNQTEIDTAVGNLPKLTDNIETATQKINNVKSFLGRWENQLLPKSSASTGSTQGQTVKTKAGVINTDW